ncbi:MAG: phenylalanine--tRNA ligase subunit alpha [Calditrichaeota bacterium]|nr:phenylalanine--tRNA ligase subunit alpha [Calditrichota bacterium]
MNQDISNIKSQFDADYAAVNSLSAVDRLKYAYLGRKGAISAQFDRMKEIPPEERRAFGAMLNTLKTEITARIEELQQKFAAEQQTEADIDLTLPGITGFRGGLHPLTQVYDEVVDIFRGLGFTVEDGPECETAYYNFDALNTPPNHPSREWTDTFYLDVPGDTWLLRTHTSPVQIRVMQRKKPPIRIIAPGRTYRNDKPDATHSPAFMQVEGLYVDKGVTFADLKGTVLAFYRALYGADVNIRLRPSFFPFTEPSAEVDVSCFFCRGKGCRICKGSGWLEMAGSGMVHPNVLAECDIDPEVYSGWAFGMGLERIALFKFGVDDIRLFYENDLRFLQQF